ncbi:MAG: hypothetical protein ACTHU0_01275, partial [Kofleriaceae bacterium]
MWLASPQTSQSNAKLGSTSTTRDPAGTADTLWTKEAMRPSTTARPGRLSGPPRWARRTVAGLNHTS